MSGAAAGKEEARVPVRVAHIATIPLSLNTFLADQMQWLRGRGLDIATVSSAGPEVALLNAAGFPHFAVPISRTITPFADLVSLARLVRLFRRERFDVVHTHTPKAGLLGQLAARIARVPIVIDTNHCLNLDPGGGRITRFIVETALRVAAAASDRILFQNHEALDYMVSRGFASREKCVYIGNGIDLSRFDRKLVTGDALAAARAFLRVSPEQRVVGFVGRLAARRKGVVDLIEAGLRVAERFPDVVFAIIGEPEGEGLDPLPADLVERATASGHFRFAGAIPNEELAPFYAAMSVLVLPSLVEGKPRVVMEAAATGVPAVVTDVQGNREAVVDRVTGRVVPYGAVDTLTGAIVDVLSDADALRVMGENARVHAAKNFEQTVTFEAVLDSYRQLLSARGLG